GRAGRGFTEQNRRAARPPARPAKRRRSGDRRPPVAQGARPPGRALGRGLTALAADCAAWPTTEPRLGACARGLGPRGRHFTSLAERAPGACGGPFLAGCVLLSPVPACGSWADLYLPG